MDQTRKRRTIAEVSAPFACVVHCAAMPLMSAGVPALAPIAALEPVVIGVSALAVGWILVRGWQEHGGVAPWLPALLGFAMWAATIVGANGTVPEIVVLLGGSLLVATGAMWNARRLSIHRCRPGECSEEGCCEAQAPETASRPRGGPRLTGRGSAGIRGAGAAS